MNNNCIVVADGSRARFFCLEDVPSPETQGGPYLTEVKGLINPEKEAHEAQLFSDSKNGGNRTNGHGVHGYDDHREGHLIEIDRRFARSIAEAAAKLARKQGARGMVLVAPNRTIGMLRAEFEPLLRNGMTIHELQKDLSKLSADKLQELLAREKLVPKRNSPMS